MEKKVATYAIISLPGNNFRIYTDDNLLTNNPAEIAPSDYIGLRGNSDFNYPAIRSTVQLAADNYKSVKMDNLLSNNPSETTSDRQLFTKVIYEEVSMSHGINAFRDAFSSGGTLRPLAEVAQNVDEQASRKDGLPKIIQYGSLFVPVV